MSPEEQTEAIRYLREERALSQATGISNKLAWKERTVQPLMASIDVDSLKWINDNLGHEAGDALLKKTAQALQEATGEAYHFSGDEFWVQGNTVDEISQKMTAAQEALQGEDVGGFAPTFSYGIGTDIKSAETAMQADKDAREAAGKRAARGEAPPARVAPVEAAPPVEPTPVVAPVAPAPAPVVAPVAPVTPIEVIEPGPAPRPDYATGLREGWQPEGARQYAERFGAVVSEQDPLSSDPNIDRIEASNVALPEQVARANPAAARKLSAEIRRNPGQFAAWSGMHPDFANKVANDLERAAARVEERGDFAQPRPEEVADFGEVAVNAQGRPFASRKAALIASQKLGMENVEIDERVADGETSYVIRDTGPGAAPLESAAAEAPVPEVVGDVQLPVNLVEESLVPPSAKITMTRVQGRREVTKQVNARKAVALSKRRIGALREMIECLS
jgi:diguanylate cyclase (GGDEF)-like protein